MSRSIWKAAYTRMQVIQSRYTRPSIPISKVESTTTFSENLDKKREMNTFKTPVSDIERKGTCHKPSLWKVWSRDFMITPNDLSKRYIVYNGKKWIEVKVLEQMIGHRFGEFCSTRQVTAHKVYKQKQKRKHGNKRSLPGVNSLFL